MRSIDWIDRNEVGIWWDLDRKTIPASNAGFSLYKNGSGTHSAALSFFFHAFFAIRAAETMHPATAIPITVTPHALRPDINVVAE